MNCLALHWVYKHRGDSPTVQRLRYFRLPQTVFARILGRRQTTNIVICSWDLQLHLWWEVWVAGQPPCIQRGLCVFYLRVVPTVPGWYPRRFLSIYCILITSESISVVESCAQVQGILYWGDWLFDKSSGLELQQWTALSKNARKIACFNLNILVSYRHESKSAGADGVREMDKVARGNLSNRDAFDLVLCFLPSICPLISRLFSSCRY